MGDCYNRVASGACTASKRKRRYPASYPSNFISGKGAYLTDGKGDNYFDLVCGLGAISLGYRYDVVDEAVAKVIKDKGTIFTLPHPDENKLANLLYELIPSAEQSVFAHNGVDVTTAAIRLARHITGKTTVLSFSYHGCQDVFMACTKADNGVPETLKTTIIDFDYNDIDTVKKYFDEFEIAAVILEPHTIRQPENYFLEFLRDICTTKKALLIFDEIVTFPRYPGFSAQQYFGVYPDLTCVSKGMANGYAISALCGRETYMKELKDNGVFFSTTFGGNLVGVSAAIATLAEIRDKDIPFYLRKTGECLAIKENNYVKLVGYPWRQFLQCEDDIRQKIWQEMIRHKVFFGVPIFINYSMTPKEMVKISTQLNEVIRRLPIIEIEGRMVTEVFKKR